MKIQNLTPFSFGTTVTSRRPPRPEMTVIVRACYLMEPGKPLALPEGPGLLAQGALTADTYRDEDEERAGECLYPGDFADWKPRAEVMLRGACHTPQGKALAECPVRFEVGRWSKILRVIGRRFWSDERADAVMSEPAPFTKMPLGYAQAFGGPGYAPNPVGKGMGGNELPSVEHAGAVIRTRRDDPGPAGFGPLNPLWPERRKKIGKQYGRGWRWGRWPYHAEDFDWSYFNAAPPDQQLDGYLRGDEALLFQNLHPAAPVFEARLPGLRIRAFVKDVQQRFREVGMSLDTLFADLDEGKLYLTWRGLDPIETDDMRDVDTLLLASEQLAEAPLPEAHYREQLAVIEADPQGVKKLIPAELLETFGDMQRRARDRAEGKQPTHDAPAPDPLTGALRATLDALPAPYPGAKDMEKGVANAVAQMIASSPPEAGLEAKIAEAGRDWHQSLAARQPPAAMPLRVGGPPPASAQKAFKKLLESVEQTRQSLAAEKLPAEQKAQLAKELEAIDREVEAFKKEPLFAAVMSRPPPREPGPEKDLSGQDYEGRDLRGADLRGATLRDANLAGANLAGANLAGAKLDGAVLVEADLSGADLTGADLTLANLTGARAPGAILRGATLNRAFFHGADLSGAVLAEARGEYTFLPEANLAGADARGLSLFEAFAQKANLAGADLSGAALTRCHFLEVDARKANLSRATLTRTSFARSDLSEATLVEARGDRSIWLQTRLHDADFTRAALPGAQFMDASAPRARFFRAILKESRCYRASFEHADFTESNLLGIDFTQCALRGARFTRANLYDAKFRQAAGAGCDFSGANLKRAMMEEA